MSHDHEKSWLLHQRLRRGCRQTMRRLLCVMVVPCLPVAIMSMAGPVDHADAATVTVHFAGTGAGTVTSSQAGTGGAAINCSNVGSTGGAGTGVCQEEYNQFSTVTLAAAGGGESSFVGWSQAGGFGSGCTTPENPCSFIAFSGPATITATFSKAERPPEAEFPTAGPVSVAPVQDITSGEATFHGRVNPQGSELKDCRFEYVPNDESGGFASTAVSSRSCTPAVGVIGDGETFEDVEAAATGLEPNTEYAVRLLAEKSSSTPRIATGKAPSYESEPVIFTTRSVPPTVAIGHAWSMSPTGATLSGSVNPHNSPLVECHFEWGTTQSYGHSVPCEPASVLGNQDIAVTANLDGLSPSSQYHFRLVADNGAGAAQQSQDAVLETYPAFAFPGRHFELVSAEDTGGIDAIGKMSGQDGSAYIYFTGIPGPGAESSVLNTFYRSSRGSDGVWSQRFIGIPAPGPGQRSVAAYASYLFSGDASSGAAVTPESLDPDDEPVELETGDTAGVDEGADVYRFAAGGQTAWISRSPLIPSGVAQPALKGILNNAIRYISPDGQDVLFASAKRLLSSDTATSGLRSLYQWRDGNLSLVGIALESTSGFANGSDLGSFSSGGANGVHATVEHAVSEDGSRIVFESGATESTERLYVRLHGERTVEASASASGAPAITGPWNVRFQGADAGVNTVYFTSSSPLTPGSAASDVKGGPADLYAYEVDSRTLRDVTPSTGGAGVERVYAVSGTGSRVYFTDSKRLNRAGELTESPAPGETLQGKAGGPNLYLAETDGGGSVGLAFIAAIDPVEDTTAARTGVDTPPPLREVSTNDEGSVLAFRSRTNLVPGRLTAGEPQVYVFDAARREVSCASCPTDGSPPLVGAAGGAYLVPATRFRPSGANAEGFIGAAGNSGVNEAEAHSANVAADGTVFFQTATQLVPEDVDGTRVDVYAFRDGEVQLISSGVSEQDSFYTGSSANGNSVFFQSSEGLVDGAEPGVVHIYDARIGSPLEASSSPPPCVGQDCRGTTPSEPPLARPGSEQVDLRGNVRPTRCAKQKVRHRVRRQHHRAGKRHPPGMRVRGHGRRAGVTRSSISFRFGRHGRRGDVRRAVCGRRTAGSGR